MVENKPSKSVRTFISWKNGPRSEPTSTLVLSSPRHCFVDVRVILPLSRSAVVRDAKKIDWAFAGTSEHDDTAKLPHTVFRHWVDSRYPDAETVRDEGDMVMGSGSDEGVMVEKGTMVNPETGREEEYEEGWRDVQIGDGEGRGWVLKYNDVETGGRGLMVKVGSDAQGVLRAGERVAVGRWKVDNDSRQTIVQVGTGGSFYMGTWEMLWVGDTLEAEDGKTWICVESW